jgi:transcriptional regulator with XRE-family HTH domain
VNDSAPDASLDFAARLNLLFASVRGPDGTALTNEVVSTAIEETGGPTISKSYLAELRRGVKDNPTLKHITALSEFFGVDPSYFVGDGDCTRETIAELRLVDAARKADIAGVALRAQDLATEAKDALTLMMQKVQEIQDLAPEASTDGEDPAPVD